MLSVQGLLDELTALRAATSRPFNVNFFCHRSPTPDAAREAAWRSALTPYYREFGLDPNATLQAPVRAPFSAEAAARLRELALSLPRQPQARTTT